MYILNKIPKYDNDFNFPQGVITRTVSFFFPFGDDPHRAVNNGFISVNKSVEHTNTQEVKQSLLRFHRNAKGLSPSHNALNTLSEGEMN